MRIAQNTAESGRTLEEEYGLRDDTPAEGGPTDTSKQAWGTGQIGCGVAAVLGLVILLVSLFSDGSGGRSKVSAPPHSSLDAYVMCKQFLEDRLKAPKTADYPLERSSDVTEALGGGRYRVRSYVDAQNSFGAMIRTRYERNLSTRMRRSRRSINEFPHPSLAD
jgi:hypothetical protein